jgi:hypothetical protein
VSVRHAVTLGQLFREEELEINPGSPRYDRDRRLGPEECRCPDCGYIAVQGTDALTAHDAICRRPVPRHGALRRRAARRSLRDRLAAYLASDRPSGRGAGALTD